MNEIAVLVLGQASGSKVRVPKVTTIQPEKKVRDITQVFLVWPKRQSRPMQFLCCYRF